MTDQTRNGERELKPCPLCAGAASLWPPRQCKDEWDGSTIYPNVYCKCGLRLHGSILVNAVDAWNPRHGEALAAQGGGE